MHFCRAAISSHKTRYRLPKFFSSIQVVLFSGFVLLLLFINTKAAVINVPSGGNLQAAINSAQPGDVIVVQAGATYLGPFVLPNKSGTSFITIQSSRASEITGRVTPSQSSLLAKLQSNTVAAQVLRTDPGAHHYKLIGLEISTVAGSDFVYDLVRLGGGDSTQTTATSTPHDLILDRLWIHGFANQDLQRGISLNSAETSIINSYISEIHGVGTDTQAICGWNGPGPYHIVNNYLEAAGENILFGGADPQIPNLVPADIEIRRNTFFKPLAWKNELPSGGHWSVKNLLELKNARRVTIDGNLFQNNWVDGQSGMAIVFTARNQDGTAPWTVVEDVTFTNNIVRNVDGGVNILRTDTESKGAITSRITISNNLFEIVGFNTFFTLLNNPNSIVITHNTVFKNSNIATLDAPPSTAKGTGLVVKDNLFSEGGYGFFGSNLGEGTVALQGYYSSFTFLRNNSAGRSSGIYPSGNTFLITPLVGFVDQANRNYRLASTSPLKNAASDGKDVGVDFDALNAAQGGTTSAPPPPPPPPTPTPTPTPNPTPTPVTGGAPEVVLWAAEAPVRVGNWTTVADSSAAGGSRISNSDFGVGKLASPLASPSSYFEMSFTAQAGVDYRLWMRGKAQSDFWGNDSAFVQFSDSVNGSGTAVFRIGTSGAAEYNLEDCSGCGIQGWGWQDNGWGAGVLGPVIRFQSSGTHTLRVQIREDGLSIDQIVLSPELYRTTSPGALRNDSRILSKTSTAPAPSSETVLMADNFNDSSFNTGIWTVADLFSGFTDAGISMRETQALEIGPLKQSIDGSHYNGLRSAASYNFTGAYAYVQLTRAPVATTAGDAFFTVGINGDNNYRIYVESGVLFAQKRIGGGKTNLISISFDSVSNAFWRIRHDAPSGLVVFETAPSVSGTPGAWTPIYVETWNTSAIPLASVRFELKAGTWKAEGPAPGTVMFDNFKAAKP